MLSQGAQYTLTEQEETLLVSAFGRWTLDNAQELYEKLKAEDTSAHLSFVSFDFSQLEDIDTSGAYLLARLLGGHDKPRRKWEVDNGTSGQMILMKAACEALQGEPPKTTRPWYDAVLRVGMASERFAKEVWETLAFIGHFFVVLGKMRQEIDAMTVIGMDTYETLVVPRALACIISTPILTFLAMMSGIFGGMIVAWTGGTEISPIMFFTRFNEAINTTQFAVGLSKTPIFGLIIAIIGCRQGLAVTGSVDSLGERTTTSVVQAIFAVIAVDALFAILFFKLGI